MPRRGAASSRPIAARADSSSHPADPGGTPPQARSPSNPHPSEAAGAADRGQRPTGDNPATEGDAPRFGARYGQREQGQAGRRRVWAEGMAEDDCVPVIPAARPEHPVAEHSPALDDSGAVISLVAVEGQEGEGRRLDPGMRPFDPGPAGDRGVVDRGGARRPRRGVDRLGEQPIRGASAGVLVRAGRPPEQHGEGRGPPRRGDLRRRPERAVGSLERRQPVCRSLRVRAGASLLHLAIGREQPQRRQGGCLDGRRAASAIAPAADVGERGEEAPPSRVHDPGRAHPSLPSLRRSLPPT